MESETVLELLEKDLNLYERRVYSTLVRRLLGHICSSPTALSMHVEDGDLASHAEMMVRLLKDEVGKTLSEIFEHRRRNAEFNVGYSRAVDAQEKREHILLYARDLGAGPRQLRGDRKAFARWFDQEAVTDRYIRRQSERERNLAFYLGRIGLLAAIALESQVDLAACEKAWKRLELEETVRPVLTYDGDERVACAAFRSLACALNALPGEIQEQSLEESTLQYILRSAMQPRQNVWIQCEALNLLQSLSLRSLQTVLEKRLTSPASGDDLFVRRHAVKVLGENLERLERVEVLLGAVVADPSPFVRQALAKVLPASPRRYVRTWLSTLAREDERPEVRAAAIVEGASLLEREEESLHRYFLGLLLEVCASEKNEFVLRAALEVAAQAAEFLRENDHPTLVRWQEPITAALDELHIKAGSLAVRRWAAAARERIWCVCTEDARRLRDQLKPRLSDIRPGKSKRLGRRSLDCDDTELTGRVLSVLSQSDFGFDVKRTRFGTKVTRGNKFRFRFWRFLHEFRNPSPDKRQGFSHTIARVFDGTLRAPSGVLAELAQTKVPGEPLFISEEQTWRPYLPLVDDMLSTLDQGFRPDPVYLYSSEGVTKICAPSKWRRRVSAFWKLCWRFPSLASMRNWKGMDDGEPGEYVGALRQLGFKVSFQTYRDLRGQPLRPDPAVARFFPAGLPFLEGGGVLDNMQQYFFSAYENTLYQLGIFAAAVMALFLGRHAIANHSLSRARRQLPLVVGGWGTRGKSGTERLKAGLFNSLGYGLVSKTTGCEAMFLYSPPFGKLRELFLYRPYDKATIWEQRNVLRLSSQLGSDVFLWECMGLTPTYVKILQRQWMRDDIATITNTYPDHEDLQGPAGINIPEVMTNFIPKGSILLASEEQMLPVLAEAARGLDTRLRTVGWLQAGLLTPDVLGRFPYEEHPFNIALVLEMAESLGVERDFALKEMADRVVADIGVLKSYPAAPVRSRRLEFTNGMSANERHGCIGNWTRLGFDKLDYSKDASVWVATVVNNRADRIPRSKVFAEILVRDVSADRHFLIGGNLNGLMGYIQESWESYSAKLSLFRKTEDDSEDPRRICKETARRLRQPLSSRDIKARLRAMLEGQGKPLDIDGLVRLWDDPERLKGSLQSAGLQAYSEAILGHLKEQREALREYEELAGEIDKAAGGSREHLDARWRKLLWKWFRRKLIVIGDYYATGSQVASTICDETPPGLFCRIMGMQNIKGTGLDFVYSWQAWEACHDASQRLRSKDPQKMEEGLKELAVTTSFGFLCQEFLAETIELVKDSPLAQREHFQAELEVIQSKLENSRSRQNLQITSSSGGTNWFEKVVGWVEEFLDAGDAVRRRKTANRIYKDLVAERVSLERVVAELQALNKRQKGGWLLKRLKVPYRVLKSGRFLLSLKRR